MANPHHNPLEGEKPELNLDLHDGTEEMISIVVVHKDRPEYLNLCLQSIAVASFHNNYEVIVVDNASGQDSQDLLESIKDDVRVIRTDKNVYWSAAANKGAAAANKRSKYIVFMHCDVVILNPAWLDILVSVCETHKSGMAGVQLSSYMLMQKKVDFVQDWLVMFTRECWEEAGPYPERLPLIGAGFLISVKATGMGYKPQVIRNQIAHHYRIFSLDINAFERMTEAAMLEIPRLLKEYQSESVKSVI